MERLKSIETPVNTNESARLLALVSFGLCLLAVLFAVASAQQNPAANTSPAGKKTDSGFEVFLQEAKSTTERDSMNNVPTYRFGSCPPGAALDGMKVLANNGNDAIIVRLSLKVLPNYRDAKVSLPVLLNADGKKFMSSNTILSQSLSDLLQTLKGKDEQLQCEFPFEVPRGTQIVKIQYNEVFFDLKPSEAP